MQIQLRKFKNPFGHSLTLNDLPNGWRLMHTTIENKVQIISALLEWFNNKKYGKRFNCLFSF